MWQKLLDNLKSVWREPVLFVAGAVWVATWVLEEWKQILVVMTALGIPTAYQTALLKIAGVLVSLGAWWVGRGYTTPVNDPRDINGVALAPYYKAK